MIAAHQTMLAPQGGPSSLDYVQDGLYYQLDGIENAGRGVHDASASTWTDLTGNGRDATFLNSSTGLSWGDICLNIHGKTNQNIVKISGLPSASAFTFEIVHRRDAADSYARLYDTEGYFGGSQPKRFCALFGSQNYPSAMSFQIGTNIETNYSSISASSSVVRAFSVTPTAYSSGYSARVCVDGVFVQTANSSSVYSPQTTTYIDVANRSNSPNRGFDGAVYAIRVYNRILTDAEIAANYATDKARFNLP